MADKRNNPFALVRASDYTDAQINALWVELGPKVIDAILEPASGVSKYILGGKGSGKTHILRYNSYQVARLRNQDQSGIQVVSQLKFLAVFMRATALDAARFEVMSESHEKWQQLFGIYFELRLAEGLTDALCDIKSTTPLGDFDDSAFINSLADTVNERDVLKCRSIEDFRLWLIAQRRRIDVAVNNAAFSGSLQLSVPFSIGALCLPLKTALSRWNPSFQDIPLIYLVDEIENFSERQQEVINSLIRYGEGSASFRVTGRLYARKTFKTMGGGEENRDGSEFKTTNLDLILKSYPDYPAFAREFILKRVGNEPNGKSDNRSAPKSYFQEIPSENYYEDGISLLKIDGSELNFIETFTENLKTSLKENSAPEMALRVRKLLVDGFPLLLQKLNLLQFCKKFDKQAELSALANQIRENCESFMQAPSQKSSYATAFGHWKGDLFAQLCRESKKVGSAQYAGFETFVAMSSSNPRNLLIILGRAFEIAAFREVDFLDGNPLPVFLQTEAAIEAARFMYERDTNYGGNSDLARTAVERLALILRTARYSLNIPEVSPLAVSFSEADLSSKAKEVLDSALNYSFVFEIHSGRPDRNSERIMKKIYLNPLLSPKWGLPVGRRGDISLGSDLANAILAPAQQSEFETILKKLSVKWNNPFRPHSPNVEQLKLL